MATFKRSLGAPEPDAGPLSLAVVEDGPRPGREHPAADALWLELRSAIREATMGTTFDLRRGLTLNATERSRWQEARRAWLRQLFADDPRVACD